MITVLDRKFAEGKEPAFEESKKQFFVTSFEVIQKKIGQIPALIVEKIKLLQPPSDRV
jgi:hypothetical protein